MVSRLFVAQAEPVVVCLRFGLVGEGGLVPVADVEEIAEDVDAGALLAFAEEFGYGDVEELAEEVEQGRLDGGDGMDGGAEVEGLQAAATGVAVGEALPDEVEDALVAADRFADDEGLRILRAAARIFSPPGTSPTPVWPALSVRMTRLRVKKGACAPLRLSSMLSRPATGMTRMDVIWGSRYAPVALSCCTACGFGELEVDAFDLADQRQVATMASSAVTADEDERAVEGAGVLDDVADDDRSGDAGDDCRRG